VRLIEGDRGVGLGSAANPQVTGNDAGFIDPDLRRSRSGGHGHARQGYGNESHATSSRLASMVV
jgi:hypothetical protein